MEGALESTPGLAACEPRGCRALAGMLAHSPGWDRSVLDGTVMDGTVLRAQLGEGQGSTPRCRPAASRLQSGCRRWRGTGLPCPWGPKRGGPDPRVAPGPTPGMQAGEADTAETWAQVRGSVLGDSTGQAGTHRGGRPSLGSEKAQPSVPQGSSWSAQPAPGPSVLPS